MVLIYHSSNCSNIFSVVSSYFVFLRWVFYVNFLLAATITVFVIIPELLTGHWKDSGVGKQHQFFASRCPCTVSLGAQVRKKMMPIEEITASNIKVLWDFEGIMR